MEQNEFLQVIQKYNSMDRQIIKKNLQIVKVKYEFENADIVKQCNYAKERVNGWFNKSNPVVPKFEDALRLAVTFNFYITELIQET